MTTLGERIKAARKLRSWTQATLATRLGASVSAVSNLEHDRDPVSLEKMIRLAAALECDPHELDDRLASTTKG